MKFSFNKPDQYRKNLIPRIESKIAEEIKAFVEEELTKQGKLNNIEREKMFNQAITSFYKALGSNTLSQFFEKEFFTTIKAFSKHFPYKSVHDFLDSELSNLERITNKSLKELP